jgi:small redox-active disulfide protein 2
MNIKILGSGCPSCQTLEDNVKKAVAELGLEHVQVEHVSDITEITEYGVMSTPAIVISEQVKVAGRIPNVEEVKKMLTEQKPENETLASGGCSCGSSC